MNGWSLEPILNSYTIIALICASLVLLTMVLRPWPPNHSRQQTRRTWILLALRFGVIAMLAFAMLRPTYVSTESQAQSATFVVLVDQSRSMNVQDLPGGRSRWKQLNETLRNATKEFESLDALMDVRAYGFDATLHPSIYQDGSWKLPSTAGGEQTDVAGALHEALQREVGKRIAGVLLLSDGSQRVYQPRYDVQQSVRELRRLNAPLYTVGFGKPRDQSQARDVAIEKMKDQYTVFVNNELEIRGGLRVQGYVNRPIPIKIDVEGPDGNTTNVLGPNVVTAQEDDELVDFRFLFAPQVAGDYKLQVSVAPQEGELVDANNRMTAYLNVLEGGIRVLYLEGNLFSPEAQILNRSLATSTDIELDFRPIDPRRRSSWPIDLSEAFKQQPYDIVLIGDVDATALGNRNLQMIADLVTKRGGGLMMTGGINALAPGGYRGTPLAPLLPMMLGQFNRQEFGADKPIRADLHVRGPIKMRPIPGRTHFITHLAAGDANEQAWQRLNQIGLLGANRLDQLRQNAILLVETDQGEPLLVARQFSPGRVLVFAADSTHRWWRYGEQDLHKRFWRQAILWLANQDEMLRRDVWVQLDRRRFRPGETVVFRAGAKSETGDVLADATLAAEFHREGNEPEVVNLTREDDQWIGELTGLEEPGEYTVEVKAALQGEPIGDAVARFQMESIDLELADPAASPQQLAMLAGMTQSAGGLNLPPEQLNALLDEIRQRPPEMKIEVQSKWRFGDGVWDTWPFFAIFVALLAVEWTLRKRWGLV